MSPTRRLLRNAGVLLSGGAAGFVFSFAASIIAARYLGAGGLGTIALVQTVVVGVHTLVNFQSWRTVIKYGSDAREADDAAGGATNVREVIKFGVALDLISSMTGALLAAVGAVFAARRFEWDDATRDMAFVYASTLIVTLTGAAVGVLRMYERYSVFVWQRLIAGPIRLIGVTVAWLADLGPLGVLGAWMLSNVAGNFVVMGFALRELHQRGLGDFWKADLRGVTSRHAGILRFSLIINLSTAVRSAWRELDSIVIGTMLSVEAVGLYRVAQQFAQVLAYAQDPLQQANYPDLARQAARGERSAFVATLLAATRIGAAVAAAYWLTLLVAGEWIIVAFVGQEFAASVPVMLWYTAGLSLSLAGFVLPNATMALGRPGVNLIAAAAATLTTFLCWALLLPRVGLVGAGMACAALYTVWLVIMGSTVLRALGAWREGVPLTGVTEQKG